MHISPQLIFFIKLKKYIITNKTKSLTSMNSINNWIETSGTLSQRVYARSDSYIVYNVPYKQTASQPNIRYLAEVNISAEMFGGVNIINIK